MVGEFTHTVIVPKIFYKLISKSCCKWKVQRGVWFKGLFGAKTWKQTFESWITLEGSLSFPLSLIFTGVCSNGCV